MLRERGGGDEVRGIASSRCACKVRQPRSTNARSASLLDSLSDPERFSRLVEQFQRTPSPDGAKVSVRVAALLQLMRTAIDAARLRGDAEVNRAFETMAESCARLTPEMMIAMLERRHGQDREEANMVSTVADRMTDTAIASFMTRAVTADRRGTERLAQALEVLVPSLERKSRIVDLAKEEALHSELAADTASSRCGRRVANTVMSYTLVSNLTGVSEDYGKELSSARTQAIEVERVSDDPPERVQAWVATVSESALARLDLEMLLDLLRIEETRRSGNRSAAIVVAEIERRTLIGDVTGAHALIESLVRETTTEGRPALRISATRTVDRLAAGPIVRHVASHFRSIVDGEVEHSTMLCQLLGVSVVRSLTDARARRERRSHSPASRSPSGFWRRRPPFGRAVEEFTQSGCPAHRDHVAPAGRRAGSAARAGVDARRRRPEVQRESIHAIVEIGTTNAYSVLHRLLLEADTPRDTALQELVSLRDDKAVPLFSYVLTKAEPRGKLIAIHISMIEALGTMKPRPESIRALHQVLLRGRWWTPFRTTTQRQAAATALRRLGTPEALAMLEAAADTGGRGVRKIARAQIAPVPKREKSPA